MREKEIEGARDRQEGRETNGQTDRETDGTTDRVGQTKKITTPTWQKPKSTDLLTKSAITTTR